MTKVKVSIKNLEELKEQNLILVDIKAIVDLEEIPHELIPIGIRP